MVEGERRGERRQWHMSTYRHLANSSSSNVAASAYISFLNGIEVGTESLEAERLAPSLKDFHKLGWA